jgi:two-component system, OmpR family, sensor kinase
MTRAAGSARSRGSLRWRIVAIVAGLLAVTNVVVGVVTVFAFQGYLVGRLDSDLHEAAARSVQAQGNLPGPPGAGSGSSTAAPAPPSGVDPNHDFIGAPGQSAGTVVAVVRNGRFVLSGYADATGTEHGLGSAARTALLSVRRDGQPETVTLGTLGSYRAIAARSDGSVFITALPLAGIQSGIERLVLVIGIVALVGIVVAGWAGAVLVRRAFRPLSSVASTASAVSDLDLERGGGDIDVRVSDANLTSGREVAQVGTALNRLIGHVSSALAVRDRAERSVREFVADASHELRTPIATIRAYAELTRRRPLDDGSREYIGRIETEAYRMGDLVEELLFLARLDAAELAAARGGDAGGAAGGGTAGGGTAGGGLGAISAVRVEVDLTALVVEALMDARAAGPDHRWAIEVDDDPVRVDGDPAQLRRAVANLLTNARTHTPAGTTVTASVHRTRTLASSEGDGPHALVTVANDGPAIDPGLLPTIFERFSRGDAARTRTDASSTGLGLAIVRAVAEAHEGTVVVTSDASATAFTIELPSR